MVIMLNFIKESQFTYIIIKLYHLFHIFFTEIILLRHFINTFNYFSAHRY